MLPVPSDFIEFVERALFSGEDVLGRFGPGEGLWLGVVLRKVVVDGGFQIADARVTASPNALCRDLGEEAFDKVQPGRAGWREMQLEARVARKPRLDLRRLVGGVIVEDEMHVSRLGESAVNAV